MEINLAKIVAHIESAETREEDRNIAISELNLSGITSDKIEATAYNYWQDYFALNIEDILSERLVIISHLLEDKIVNQCFQDVFQEYQDKRKQMGIDDIRKFWAP